MGLSQFPTPTLTAVAATYGASTNTGGTSISGNTTYISAASISLTTITANTKWLIEVDADLRWGTSAIANCIVGARVDGGDWGASGGVSTQFFSGSGGAITELPIRGRVVVTLASVGSHTITGAVYNGSGNAVTLNAIAVTATQLAG